MEETFFREELKLFFETLQRPAYTRREVLDNVQTAIALIAELWHIGKVAAALSTPGSGLREQINNAVGTLYQSSRPAGDDAVLINFRTGEGGNADLYIYPEVGYQWTEEERRELLILGRTILEAFRLETMDFLLRRTMTMDMSVSMPNMTGYMARLGKMCAQGTLANYMGFYFNTHNFKYVNKALSHQKADEVMRQYAALITQGIEKDECVARLGGDNFVAVIRRENAEAYIQRISNVEIIYRDGEKDRRFSFGATIGVSGLENIHEPGEVMMRTSSAYQTARQRDSKEVVYFSEEIQREIMYQKEIIAGFFQGIARQEFEVYYQPKVNTEERCLCGAEALIRWHRNGKMIPPMEFIPILEKEGSICTLDFYVLDKVCEFLEECIREKLPLHTISVNFSKRHMENPHLAQEIVGIIDKHQVPHNYIEIELTESEDVKDYIVLAQLIEQLKAVGVSASVDDFGTGYSSLNMLKMIHTDVLKIDKSFIPFGEDESDNQKDCIMFESIIKLAKALGFQIVVEGVETEQQYAYMHEVGCDIIQGYYFDRPLPKREFLNRLTNGQY